MNFDTRIYSIDAMPSYSDRMKAGLLVRVVTASGAEGEAIWSPGISVGRFEEKPMYDETAFFNGCGQERAAKIINEEIGPSLVGMDSILQAEIDNKILSFGEKAAINVRSSLSNAILKAASASLNIPLFQHIGGVRAFTMPTPAALIATGSNRYGFDKGIGYKPTYSFLAYGFEDYNEASVALWNTYMNWNDFMTKKLSIKMQPIAGMAIPKGKLDNDYQLWQYMNQVIHESGYDNRIGIQVDMSASSFYDEESQSYIGLFSPEPKGREEMIEIVKKMAKEYNFVSIEDPLCETDEEGFKLLTQETGIQIVADDLIGGSFSRLKKMIHEKACNAIRVAPGQIGTVTEVEEYALYASERKIALCVCGERGSGVDACDYAVALNAANVKEMGMCYSGNRLSDICSKIGHRVRFINNIGLVKGLS